MEGLACQNCSAGYFFLIPAKQKILIRVSFTLNHSLVELKLQVVTLEGLACQELQCRPLLVHPRQLLWGLLWEGGTQSTLLYIQLLAC